MDVVIVVGRRLKQWQQSVKCWNRIINLRRFIKMYIALECTEKELFDSISYFIYVYIYIYLSDNEL